MSEAEKRNAVIAEARTWQGTPFVWQACVKGVGVDCGRFLAGVMVNAGVKSIDIAALPRMSPQWFLHREDGSFVDQVRRFAVEYQLEPGQKPRPGDIVVARMGRDWAHSAIVIDWPRVIGAANEHVVTEWADVFASPQFGTRELRYFDPFHPAAGGARV